MKQTRREHTGEKKTVTLCAVGDVAVDRDDPESLFTFVSTVLNNADITFGQLEQNFSERGCAQVQHRHPMRSHPRMAAGLTSAGFDVISFASNHCMDFGDDAFFDTIETLQKNNIQVVGVGKDLSEARKPAIIERNGVRVAFLAYNSILPAGYEAGPNKPGCVPIKANTLYQQIEVDQPGTPCRILTYPDRQDVEAMREDIKKAKSLADIIIVSCHWGLHLSHAKLATYQREVGHAAIDAGADLILGHHAHILKGIEVYNGKVIFHSLANFAFDAPFNADFSFTNPTPLLQELIELYQMKVDPDYPGYSIFPVDSRKTIIAKIVISDKKIQSVSFLPVFINKYAQPQILSQKDENFDVVLSYMERISREVGLDTQFTVKGNEVLIST